MPDFAAPMIKKLGIVAEVGAFVALRLLNASSSSRSRLVQHGHVITRDLLARVPDGISLDDETQTLASRCVID